MIDLLLIFLTAAWLESLALARYFDHAHEHPTAPWPMFASAGLSLLLTALWLAFPHPVPATVVHYQRALSFMLVAVLFAQCLGAKDWRDHDFTRRLRDLLPVGVANAAVVAFALLDQRRAHPIGETLAFCLGANLALLTCTVAFRALRQRLDGSDVPTPWRGTPINVLTAAMMALSVMGFPGLLQ